MHGGTSQFWVRLVVYKSGWYISGCICDYVWTGGFCRNVTSVCVARLEEWLGLASLRERMCGEWDTGGDVL